jgi:hypothetical protein
MSSTDEKLSTAEAARHLGLAPRHWRKCAVGAARRRSFAWAARLSNAATI